MTELRLDTWTMPSARLGPEDPLPQLAPPGTPHGQKLQVHKSVPAHMLTYLDYGAVNGCLPYRLQSDYARSLAPRSFRTAVLENDVLRATFLLELGGRLWSLLHKPSGRELLSVNPVFQPANLAIRNAWFSGGVEWNVGFRGHSPFTCSPVFAARVRANDGTPILRLYEWERVRCMPFQIDFSLPDGSPFLFVRVRLVNPHDAVTPAYWWSNIAVPEAEGSRVLVPADQALRLSYQGMVRLLPMPVFEGTDLTYPVGQPASSDYFYCIEDGSRPWIASLDRDGRGLVHVSTSRLRGRKMFQWGGHPGGRRWQEFLSPGGQPYFEIQAGLARTQSECLPMPPHAEWTWLEAYGLMEADPAAVHGRDWRRAVNAVESRLGAMLPAAALESALVAGAAAAARKPEEILATASGWGALEQSRRAQSGEPPFCDNAMVFDDKTLGPEQAPWLALLQSGALQQPDPAEPPGSWMIQPEWRRLLESSVAAGQGDHWAAWLHLGVMAYAAGEVDAARDAWEKSSARTPSVWALRNLAVLAAREGRTDEAIELYLAAQGMAPDLAPLANECCYALLRAGRHRDVLDLLGKMPEHVRSRPRIRIAEAQAALELRDFETARRILESDLVLADLREGDALLSDLWFRMHEERIAAEKNIAIDEKLEQRVLREFPLPAHLDFRMFGERRRRRRA